MKTMGVNAIRPEGHIMPADFFEQMDAAGILINGGFQCCDAWEVGGTLNQAQLNVLQNSAQTIGTNLRNHPSVFSFQWSDNQPSSQQEQVSIAGFTAGRLLPADAVDCLGRIQVHCDARARGREGGAVRLGTAGLLV
jgi:exo-1,4-beta-D-glucosaminidase